MADPPNVRVLAALSFEDRCTATVSNALVANHPPEVVIMLDYASRATPGVEAADRRNANWQTISALAHEVGVRCERFVINPYSMTDLLDLLAIHIRHDDQLLADITCMTRPHVLALAHALSRDHFTQEWSVAYTRPLSYGDLNAPSASGGWTDTLWLPMGENPILRNQGLALGVFAAGHQADRAGIALREIEPAAGVAMYFRRGNRPDLHRVALARNQQTFEYLSHLRMPGKRGKRVQEFLPNLGWEILGVDVDNFEQPLAAIVGRIIAASVALDSPIILYPFGPKSVIFYVAWLLASDRSDHTWAIYPVSRTHALNYSDGILSTETFSRSHLNGYRSETSDGPSATAET